MRLLGLVALTVAALVTAAPAVDAGSRHRVCGPAKARTLAESSLARVFVLYDGDHGHHIPYACGRGHDLRRELSDLYERECLGSSSGCGGLGKLRVAGRFVAYEDYMCCGSDGSASFKIAVLDARTMRLRTRVRSNGMTSRLVLRASGAAAWSYQTVDDETVRGYVRRFPGCGRRALVARGPGVEVESLRLVPDGIAWRADGAERKAWLCRPPRPGP